MPLLAWPKRYQQGGSTSMAEVENSKAQAAPGFFTLRVAALLLGSVPEFDLYIQHTPGDPMVLFRRGSTPIVKDDLVRLRDNGVDKIFIRDVESEAYHRYTEQNLGRVLANERTNVQEKSRILYDVSHHALHEIFDNPRSPDMVPRTRNLVENTLKLLFDHESAFKNIVKEMAYDYSLYTHSVNVSVMSITLAHTGGIEDRKLLLDIGHGALLHDIGKSMLDPALLHHNGPLSEIQWAEMRLHPVYGYNILKSQGLTDKTILDIARHHHENVGGGGYPDNLAGAEISPAVRVTMICDRFDALTTHRIYQDAKLSFEALQIMRDEMRSHLDPFYFEIFVRLMGPGAPAHHARQSASAGRQDPATDGAKE